MRWNLASKAGLQCKMMDSPGKDGIREAGGCSEGTDGSIPDERHQNCHLSGDETVRSGASGCESGVNHGSRSAHEKAPPGSGRADSSKRVRRFE
ncbi:MAG TPA: hypothetical protein DCX60_02455, partial [Phycisphaerales bacterium]|nr:hypothetical protein [Phycisphaerales bacterium]